MDPPDEATANHTAAVKAAAAEEQRREHEAAANRAAKAKRQAEELKRKRELQAREDEAAKAKEVARRQKETERMIARDREIDDQDREERRRAHATSPSATNGNGKKLVLLHSFLKFAVPPTSAAVTPSPLPSREPAKIAKQNTGLSYAAWNPSFVSLVSSLGISRARSTSPGRTKARSGSKGSARQQTGSAVISSPYIRTPGPPPPRSSSPTSVQSAPVMTVSLNGRRPRSSTAPRPYPYNSSAMPHLRSAATPYVAQSQAPFSYTRPAAEAPFAYPRPAVGQAPFSYTAAMPPSKSLKPRTATRANTDPMPRPEQPFSYLSASSSPPTYLIRR